MLRPRTIAPLGLALALAACAPVGSGSGGASDSPGTSSTGQAPSPAASSTPVAATSSSATSAGFDITAFDVPAGSHPHDVAPATDGGVWYTGQHVGTLGHLDPATGTIRETPLGPGSSPHGVIVGPDGAPWVTDGGQNAIVRVDPKTSEVKVFTLPGPNVNLNTAAFDSTGILWFTGQSGYYGRLDPKSGDLNVMKSPRGAGPYGITSTPDGRIFYASLANSHIAWIDTKEGTAFPIDPPTRGQGARRVWSDSKSQIWVSEWSAGQLGFFSAHTDQWREWKLPGTDPMAYAVYVDESDIVWLTDFGANAIVRFDPRTETFTSYPHAQPNAAVRQLLGRPGEVWGAMSGQDKLLLIRTR